MVRADLAHLAAKLEDGDAIAELDGFLEFMGDENHRLSLRGQAAHQGTQFRNALRRQHRCRFIEDQHTAVAQLGAQDFHLLLLAERQACGMGIDVDGHAELFADYSGAAAEFAKLGALHPWRTEQEIFANRQGRHQHRMLEHGSDTERQGVAGRIYFGNLVVN